MSIERAHPSDGEFRLRLLSLALVSFGCLLVSAAPDARAQAQGAWSLTEVGPFNGEDTHLRGFNNRGQGMGITRNPFGDLSGAFFYAGGHLSAIEPPPGDLATLEMVGINDSGQVIGNVLGQGFVYANGQTALLPRVGSASGPPRALAINNGGDVLTETHVHTASGSTRQFVMPMTGRAINDRGQVLGSAFQNGESFGVLDSGKAAVRLGPPGSSSEAWAVNNLGQSAGNYNGNMAAIFDAQGRVTELGRLGGRESTAIDINDRGQAVGTATYGPVSNKYPLQHSFVYSDGATLDLYEQTDGFLFNGRRAVLNGAYDINELGQALINTTYLDIEFFDRRFYLWDNGKVIDINLLLQSLDDRYGRAFFNDSPMLNELGQITLNVYTAGFGVVPVVLTPVPEPDTVVLMLAGLMSLWTLRRLGVRAAARRCGDVSASSISALSLGNLPRS